MGSGYAFVMGEAGGVLLFVSGKMAEQVTVGEGAQRFSAVAIVSYAGGGKDRRLRQLAKRGQGNAVSAIEVSQCGKEILFEIGVGAAALLVLGLRLQTGLRRGIGACSFTNSHGGLL